MSLDRVAVVGAGLIGGSVARRLAALGGDVVVVDPDAATRAAAAGAGLSVADGVPADRRLVVLATPLDVLPDALVGAARAAPGAVLVDVGSTKTAAARAAEAAGLAERYVGAHPMAGTERSGFAHSDAGLLVGATWAVTRGAGPVVDVVGWLLDAFAATVLVTDAAAHDRAVALVSHAPHVLANALLETVAGAGDPIAAHLAAGSLRDGTRVGGRNAARTANMLAENADALRPVLDDLLGRLSAYRAALDAPIDPAALRARLEDVVVDAGALRDPELAWVPCADLAAAVGDAEPVLLRQGVGGTESASV